MDRSVSNLGTALLFATLLPGQVRQVEKIVVPAADTVKVSATAGAVTVKAYGGKEVMVEGRGPKVDHDNNVVTVRTNGPGDLAITVPVNTSLQLRSISGGEIKVDGVRGEIDASNVNGKVTLTNVAGTVVAHSMNGSITTVFSRIDSTRPMSFSTMNGNIDVTLPATVKANVTFKTGHGEVYSDFEIRPDTAATGTITEPNQSKDGKYRVRSDNTLRGTINGGGPEIQFRSYNGRIYIRKAP